MVSRQWVASRNIGFRPRVEGSEAGFSILELMIALAILGVIVAQMSATIISQGTTERSQRRKLETLDSARLSLDLIAADTRNAGFMVPRWAGVAAVDGVDGGGNPAADRLCLSDASYFDLPVPGSAATTVLDLKTDRYTGVAVTSHSTSGGSRVLQLPSLDVDGFAKPPTFAEDFKEGEGIIIAKSDGQPTSFPAKGLATHCARILAVKKTAPRTVTLAVGHDFPDPNLFPVGDPNTIAVPAVVYEVVTDPAAPTGTGLMRNGTLLGTLVEDLQVELWVDVSGTPNGVVDAPTEFPIHDFNSMPLTMRDSARIRRVQISVVARASMPETVTGNFRRPAVANRPAGAPDGVSRKVLQAAVLPRNLLEPNVYGEVP